MTDEAESQPNPKIIPFRFRRIFSSKGQVLIDDHLSGKEKMLVSGLDKKFQSVLQFAEYMNDNKLPYKIEVTEDFEQISVGNLFYYDEGVLKEFQNKS